MFTRRIVDLLPFLGSSFFSPEDSLLFLHADNPDDRVLFFVYISTSLDLLDELSEQKAIARSISKVNSPFIDTSHECND